MLPAPTRVPSNAAHSAWPQNSARAKTVSQPFDRRERPLNPLAVDLAPYITASTYLRNGCFIWVMRLKIRRDARKHRVTHERFSRLRPHGKATWKLSPGLLEELLRNNFEPSNEVNEYETDDCLITNLDLVARIQK